MDKNLIHDNILELGSIGKSASGGVNRIFGSEYLKLAQTFVKAYMQEAGMESWIDSIGNVHGVYKCRYSSAKTILTGSHIDTVQEGGMLDGVLGVVAAVECVRELSINKIVLKNDIHVVATTGEEGNDLGGTVGSRAMMGSINYEEFDFLQKAKKFGLEAAAFKNAILDITDIKCYLELHIEQGNTLDNDKGDIGIVSGIVGLQRYLLKIKGISNHAGTTMMSYRKDAMVDAARVILTIDSLARAIGHNFVATVGKLEVFPNSVAVIPRLVELVLEFRNQDSQLMELFIEMVKNSVKEFADVDFSLLVKKSPVNCSSKLITCIESICSKENINYRIMPSGATHDGNAMALKMPIGMLFVPSKGGISHSSLEYTEWDNIYKGVEVLYKTLRKLGEADEDISY
jgi:hydantoinase/carbamoylase family amidase